MHFFDFFTYKETYEIINKQQRPGERQFLSSERHIRRLPATVSKKNDKNTTGQVPAYAGQGINSAVRRLSFGKPAGNPIFIV
ncbi:hypothetical protein LS482_01630 [Sinomicrobium kalidii]|uniref:hypothetical protein n=1 Tax=Sinomicrobium kalidii TaxID=2900738 RepID=UPI001E3658F0|nr:hypothetical protein [Sinomicrobium kalidii]UGU16582.1 hypothetical protein LS482_01630 [Sinomicrobium kalidii]